MFARVLECQAKDGKGVQISTKVTNDVLPSLQKQPGFVDFFALSDRFTEDARTMAVTSNQSCEPKAHLREGAIYSDSYNNIIRLLSIRGDYCAYVYVASGDPRSEIHGSLTGLTRRNAFEAGFVFVAECAEDWNGSHRKRSDRVRALHIPSSPGSIDFALESEPPRRRS